MGDRSVVIGVLASEGAVTIPAWGEALPHQAIFQTYLSALDRIDGVCSVLLPASLRTAESAKEMVKRLDGLLLPSGASNVSTELYSKEIEHIGRRDWSRDTAAVSLIIAALETAKPILGICRGFQELNVALGGNLITALHDKPECFDHRANRALPFPDRHLPSHSVQIDDVSWLGKLLTKNGISPANELQVNSLHGQGIGQLGTQLVKEACASDGTIEVIRLDAPDRFALGIQWHPEWYQENMPINRILFTAFVESCRKLSESPSPLPFSVKTALERSHRYASPTNLE